MEIRTPNSKENTEWNLCPWPNGNPPNSKNRGPGSRRLDPEHGRTTISECRKFHRGKRPQCKRLPSIPNTPIQYRQSSILTGSWTNAALICSSSRPRSSGHLSRVRPRSRALRRPRGSSRISTLPTGAADRSSRTGVRVIDFTPRFLNKREIPSMVPSTIPPKPTGLPTESPWQRDSSPRNQRKPVVRGRAQT